MTGRSLSGALRGLALAAAMGGGAAAAPQVFPDPEAAAAAVIAALEARDRAALVAIFGPESEDVILSGDDVADRAAWGEFLRDWRVSHRIVVEDGVGTLYVGRDQWPFPGPLVEGAAGWSFDAEAAREEVLLRRIGENELSVIEVMGLYVEAQRAFRDGDPDGDGVRAFAASVISSPGARDGLYWPPEPGGPESPIGDFMARAAAEGYSFDGADTAPEPFHGYYYRILTRQGAEAPGGSYDYMVGGRMLAGHALLAFPAAYGDSGIMSFMVGEAGVVYEAYLGEDTAAAAGGLDAFAPGEVWAPAED